MAVRTSAAADSPPSMRCSASASALAASEFQGSRDPGVFEPGPGGARLLAPEQFAAEVDGLHDVVVAGVLVRFAEQGEAFGRRLAEERARQRQPRADFEPVRPAGEGGGGGGFRRFAGVGVQQAIRGARGQPRIVRPRGAAAVENGAGVRARERGGAGIGLVLLGGEPRQGFGVGQLAPEGGMELLVERGLELGGRAPGVVAQFGGDRAGIGNGAGRFGVEDPQEFEAIQDGRGEQMGAGEGEMDVVEEEFLAGDALRRPDGEQGLGVEQGNARFVRVGADDVVDAGIGAQAQGVGVARAGEKRAGFGGAVCRESQARGAEEGFGVVGIAPDGVGVEARGVGPVGGGFGGYGCAQDFADLLRGRLVVEEAGGKRRAVAQVHGHRAGDDRRRGGGGLAEDGGQVLAERAVGAAEAGIAGRHPAAQADGFPAAPGLVVGARGIEAIPAGRRPAAPAACAKTAPARGRSASCGGTGRAGRRARRGRPLPRCRS
jgi:hypothetical protein